jgi:oligopeptide transport system substrate-binding protein
MKKAVQSAFLAIIILMVLLSGCTSAVSPASPVPLPTNTLQPTNTTQPTETPEPTPLPGQVLTPLDALNYGIPWLAMDKSKIPMIVYYGFNINQAPFNDPKVRQAFAAALDSEALTAIYKQSTFYNNEKSARTVIPPETLTRDVSGAMGIPYDPALAKQLLSSAGFEDPASFPETTLLVMYIKQSEYPGIIINAAQAAIKMWKNNLDVTVKLDVIGTSNDMANQQQTLIRSGKYQIFEAGVWAGVNDPDSFVSGMFGPNGNGYFNGYSDRITQLINDGANEVDPANRLPIYLELDRILSEEDLPLIPLFHCTVDGSKW